MHITQEQSQVMMGIKFYRNKIQNFLTKIVPLFKTMI